MHTHSLRSHSPADARPKSLPLFLTLLTVLLVRGAAPPAAGASVSDPSSGWTPNGKGYILIVDAERQGLRLD